MDVSIIIVNYNTKRLLCDCLESVFRETYGIDFETIVVDNASIDGSESSVTERFPQVIWVNAGGNLGFGSANNLGAWQAKGNYLFLLNSDTLLCNNAVGLFYEYMQIHSHEEIGALGGWLLNRELKHNKSYGDFPSPRSEIHYLFDNFLSKKEPENKCDKEVDYIVGADMFVSRDLFMQFNGFDPNIFMYYEETDLQFRMAETGYVRRLITGPKIIHLEGGSFDNKGLTVNRFIMAQQSYNYYLKKHFSGLRYIYYKLALTFVRLTLFFTTNWSLKEKIKAYVFVLGNKQRK